jgi:hypothetical protein
MTGELCDLPRREALEDADRELAALRLQPRDLIADVHFGVGADVPQLFDLRFELGDRLLKIEKRDGHK